MEGRGWGTRWGDEGGGGGGAYVTVKLGVLDGVSLLIWLFQSSTVSQSFKQSHPFCSNPWTTKRLPLSLYKHPEFMVIENILVKLLYNSE